MRYDPEKHHRRSIRLAGYDYSQAGAYFVTICTQNRASLFGSVADGEIQLNKAGQIAKTAWEKLPARFSSARLDASL
jgi:putative transposase